MAPQLLHRLIIWAVAVQQQRMPHRGRLLPTQRVLVTAKKQPPVFAMVRSREVPTLNRTKYLRKGEGEKVPLMRKAIFAGALTHRLRVHSRDSGPSRG
jgi:hypothetical protein